MAIPNINLETGAFQGSPQPPPTWTISAATNASPIAITTSAAHDYATGDSVIISGALGNTAANGTWTITVTGATTFTLNGSTGNGAYTGGGTVIESIPPPPELVSFQENATHSRNMPGAASLPMLVYGYSLNGDPALMAAGWTVSAITWNAGDPMCADPGTGAGGYGLGVGPVDFYINTSPIASVAGITDFIVTRNWSTLPAPTPPAPNPQCLGAPNFGVAEFTQLSGSGLVRAAAYYQEPEYTGGPMMILNSVPWMEFHLGDTFTYDARAATGVIWTDDMLYRAGPTSVLPPGTYDTHFYLTGFSNEPYGQNATAVLLLHTAIKFYLISADGTIQHLLWQTPGTSVPCVAGVPQWNFPSSVDSTAIFGAHGWFSVKIEVDGFMANGGAVAALETSFGSSGYYPQDLVAIGVLPHGTLTSGSGIPAGTFRQGVYFGFLN